MNRKEQFQRAAHQELLQHGPRGLKLKDIASAAGVTPAAVLYHYPNLDDLVREIYEEACTRWYTHREREIAGLKSPTERLSRLISQGMPTNAEDASVRLLCELEGMSVRNVDYAALMQDLFDQQVSLYQTVLIEGEEQSAFQLKSSPLTIARALVALEDSLSYYILNRHPSLGYPECIDIVISAATSFTGHVVTTET